MRTRQVWQPSGSARSARVGLIQQLPGSHVLSRHRHLGPYAAIPLSGRYLECGDLGRVDVVAGTVVVHGAYEAHMDFISAGGAEVINVTVDSDCPVGTYTSVRLDDVLRMLRCGDDRPAALLLNSTLKPLAGSHRDWRDLLVKSLRMDSAPSKARSLR